MIYTGLDEAGKGEYFGPLVIAGFILNDEDKQIVEDLKTFAQDSKKLTKKKIDRFYNYIQFHYPDKFLVKIIEPVEYNKLYDEKPNQLHIITDTYNQLICDFANNKNISNFIIDKYTSSKYTNSVFKNTSQNLNINIFQEDKADIYYLAASVASIIAKYSYNNFINNKSNEHGINLSVGSSTNALPTARHICEKYSFNYLRYFVKLHFKITKNI